MRIDQLRIFTEPQQGASYDTLLAVARRTEELGFGAFFRSDHYLKMGSVSGRPGPTDALVTLAGLARETTGIRLGTLVSPVTFRNPAQLAVIAAQIDDMSGGRLELGLGTGWFEREHTAFGLAFPSTGERFDALADELAILRGLWETPAGEPFSYSGRVHSVIDNPGLPKPRQATVPIIMGGKGRRRTPQLAAEYAAEFNTPFVSLDTFVDQRERVLKACARAGRDEPMTFSAALVVCVGRDEKELERRAAAIGREPGELRANGAAGTVEEAAATLRRWHDAGAERIYLQVLDLTDLDHLDLIATDVVPHLT
jgi:F420-dependent oxidoreductase-like protein